MRDLFAGQAQATPHDAKQPGEGWIANPPGVRPCEHLYRGDVRELVRRLERLFRALAWWRVGAAHP